MHGDRTELREEIERLKALLAQNKDRKDVAEDLQEVYVGSWRERRLKTSHCL